MEMSSQNQSNSIGSAATGGTNVQPAALSAQAIRLLNDGSIDEAVAVQRQLVNLLGTLGDGSHWQTRMETALLKEMELVCTLEEEQQTTYSTARRAMVDGERQMAAGNDSADVFLASAMAGFRAVLGEDSVSMAVTTEQLGILDFNLKQDFSKAKQYFTRAAAIWTKIHGEDHPVYTNALALLGTVCLELKDLDQAEALFREALSRERKVFGATSVRRANLLQKLSSTMVEKGKPIEAEAMSLQAISIAEEAASHDALLMAACLLNLANVHLAYGEYGNAYSRLRRSSMFFERALNPFSLGLARVFDRSAKLLRKLDRSHEAKVMEDKAEAIHKHIRSVRAQKKESRKSPAENGQC